MLARDEFRHVLAYLHCHGSQDVGPVKGTLNEIDRLASKKGPQLRPAPDHLHGTGPLRHLEGKDRNSGRLDLSRGAIQSPERTENGLEATPIESEDELLEQVLCPSCTAAGDQEKDAGRESSRVVVQELIPVWLSSLKQDRGYPLMAPVDSQ